MEKSITTENRLTKMEQKIDNLTEKVQDISCDIKNHVKWEAEKYEKLDGKYSGKWVEKAIISIGTAVIISIILAFIKFM
jgi:Txe/YoeB family toxin of Txe-Axe toxin-antitoxin module